MKEISEILKSSDLRARSYKNIGSVTIADTDKGKYVIKKNNNKDYIYNYLNTRNFNYYPEIIKKDKFILSKYVDDINIPDEQRMLDMIDLVSLLHSKTTHYKDNEEDEYKTIYEDLSNNYEYLNEYYNDIINILDERIFFSPSEYLLASNISYIFSSINLGKKYIEDWFKKINGKSTMRKTIVHNNLKLSHFIRNNKDYLISWDKSKIDIPIFDLYNLYNNHYLDFDFYEILRRYESRYPLKDEERDLLFILITMPFKLEYSGSEYDMCIKISNEIDRLYKSNYLIEQYKKSINKN